MKPLPLNKIRVLDLSRVLAGPWCAQALADLGADVVKVERPDGGDETRAWGPPFVASNHPGEDRSAYFCASNRGKRSIALDFKQANDRAVLQQLLGKADVVVENFLPSVATQFGLHAEALRAQFPRLIIASIRGFASNTKQAHQPAFDAMIQARGGLMHITGEHNGPPQKVGVAVADLFSGMYLTQAICAALFARERTGGIEGGEGAHIEVALLDAQIAMLANQASNHLIGGSSPHRIGNAHPNIVPYQTFATLDGNVMVAAGAQSQFERLAHLLQRSDWLNDARFCSNADRVTHRDDLIDQMAGVFATQSTTSWLKAMQDAQVPCAPVQSIEQAMRDSAITEGDLLQPSGDPDLPCMVGSPIRLNQTRLHAELPPPRLNQNRDEILRDWLSQD